MKRFQDLIRECLSHVREVYPWDLRELMDGGAHPLLLDVREPYEFDAMHIEGSINVPRGIRGRLRRASTRRTVRD